MRNCDTEADRITGRTNSEDDDQEHQLVQPRITIAVGATIEWTNADPFPHSVTAIDKSFNSGLIQPGKTYRHAFTKVGTFNFYCMPHPFMKGIVVVTAH